MIMSDYTSRAKWTDAEIVKYQLDAIRMHGGLSVSWAATRKLYKSTGKDLPGNLPYSDALAIVQRTYGTANEFLIAAFNAENEVQMAQLEAHFARWKNG